MNDLCDTVLTIFLVALLTEPWAYSMLAARTFYPANGITAMNLAFNCQHQYYYPPEKSVNTLVLTCPNVEMVRLRPFPVEQPWFEDGLDQFILSSEVLI